MRPPDITNSSQRPALPMCLAGSPPCKQPSQSRQRQQARRHTHQRIQRIQRIHRIHQHMRQPMQRHSQALRDGRMLGRVQVMSHGREHRKRTSWRAACWACAPAPTTVWPPPRAGGTRRCNCSTRLALISRRQPCDSTWRSSPHPAPRRARRWWRAV